MAANRHLGRIVALQTLYELDFRGELHAGSSIDEIIERNLARYAGQIGDTSFVHKLVDGTLKNVDKIDEQLTPAAPEWPLGQISFVDRAILRIGCYELKYSGDIPPKVAIDEAIELAKAFGGDSSASFINGALGALIDSEAIKEPKKSATQKEVKHGTDTGRSKKGER